MGGDCGQPCRELEVLARLGENKGRTEEIKELVLKLQDRLSRVSRPCELEKSTANKAADRVNCVTPLAEDIQKHNDILSFIQDKLNDVLSRLEV